MYITGQRRVKSIAHLRSFPAFIEHNSKVDIQKITRNLSYKPNLQNLLHLNPE